MASTIVELQLPSGVSPTLSLYADGSDTLANSGGADTLTEATNRLGLYTATVTEALSGLHFAKILVGSNVLATGWVYLEDDTSTYTVVDEKPSAEWSDGGRLDAILDDVLTDTGTTLPGTLTTIDGKVDTVDTNVDAVLVDTGTTLPGILGTPAGADLATDIAAIDTVVDAVLVDTGTTLPASLATIEGKVDTVDTNVDAILVDTGTTIPATLSGLNDLSAAQVNAEVLDVLNTDTFAEPSAVPAATASLVDKLGWVTMVSRNRLTQTATTSTVFADDGSTSVATSTVSDNGTTFTKGEFS